MPPSNPSAHAPASLAPCPSCGESLTPGHRFCGHCGAAATSRAGRERIAHYRLESVIAEGGMGMVFRAYDERLERAVAVKLLRAQFASDEEFRSRFIHEWRGAASLDHPNILPVFDAGDDDGDLYIATRLVEGEDLRRVIERDGPLSVERTLRISAQVGAALDYAHAHGIVHRDVKPGNVLIVPGSGDEQEHAYLIDFGILKRADGAGANATRPGRFIGTPDYAAPEQLLAEALTGRADQYALGGVVFHCLTGRPPYTGGSSAVVMQAHLSAPTPRVSDERDDVPAALDEAVFRAMDKDPDRRFESCRAFLVAAQAPSRDTVTAVLEAPRRIAAPVTVARETPRAIPAPAATPTGPRRRPAIRVAAAAALSIGVVAAAALAAGAFNGAPAAPDRAARQATPSRTAEPTVAPKRHVKAASPSRTTALDVSRLTFVPHRMKGYSVSLPAGWRLSLDQAQPAPGETTRMRTTATDPAQGTSVVIDHLTHFDTAPLANRDQLESDYAKNRAGYSFASDDDYELAGRPTYEWRYSIGEGAELRRRANLMFRVGANHFAVQAEGRTDLDSLAALAKAVAKSVTPAGAGAERTAHRRPRDARVPESGVYSGTGTQHLDGSDNPGIGLTMSIGGDGSTVEYTTLSCTARLVPAGFDGRRRVYRERFVSGGCDDPGTWKVLKTSDTELDAVWSSPGDAYTVTADLTR